VHGASKQLKQATRSTTSATLLQSQPPHGNLILRSCNIVLTTINTLRKSASAAQRVFFWAG